MKFSAALDVNVVAHEAADEVTVLLELEAPASAVDTARAPSALQIVLDRSGSMHGAPLEGAKQALVALVQRLEPTDVFGLVVFDSQADVIVPAAPLADKQAVIAQINEVGPRGSTDLSSGYLRGLREIRRATGAAGIRGGTMLVISDGHVNAGIEDPEQMAEIVATAAAAQMVTSTLGYGRGYDETMLTAMTRAGNGNHVFADDPDAAAAAIAGEVDGLLSKVAQAVSVTVQFEPQVQSLQLYNDLPAHQIGDGQVMVELGDFFAQEQRKLLLRLGVDGLPALGLAQIAQITLQYVEMPDLVEQTVTLPISVNVVPGDELGDRMPDPTVQSERLFQEAQAMKLKASRAYESGDRRAGDAYLAETVAGLADADAIAPAGVSSAILAEMADVKRMRAESDRRDASYMSKRTRASYQAQNRKRGQQR
ncbi:VWA domain-containing protein [Gordonia sp. CPCC 205515]|uniref:vWA domain-containing protein n=1 Tax=Gordonia sp. CPCC 205515 TaxID=3140791 RepID=UPI003AF3D2F1